MSRTPKTFQRPPPKPLQYNSQSSPEKALYKNSTLGNTGLKSPISIHWPNEAWSLPLTDPCMLLMWDILPKTASTADSWPFVLKHGRKWHEEKERQLMVWLLLLVYVEGATASLKWTACLSTQLIIVRFFSCWVAAWLVGWLVCWMVVC